MCCYSLLVCSNNVCVCVCGEGFLWVNMYVHVVWRSETPWALFPRYGPLCILRYGLSLLEIGSLRPPLCLLHQDYKHMPPCIAEMFLTQVLEVTLRSLCLPGKFFTNRAISSVYDSILIATIWTTFIILISRLEYKNS